MTLSGLRGSNIVLLFFPRAFTSVCTAARSSVRDKLIRYNKMDAKVLGISVDPLFTLTRYKEEQQPNFDLLIDFNKEVSTAYGALYSDFAFGMKGVSNVQSL